jgi:type I restriction enzyme M protein
MDRQRRPHADQRRTLCPGRRARAQVKADFAFVLHALNYLSSKGRAAIVCFPGIFYRGGAEQKIRQYLVDNNYVETVISLAPNLFYGTTIAVNILVLAKMLTPTSSDHRAD